MTAILLPNGKQHYDSVSGAPLAGGLVYTYDAGTSNARLTWADALQTTPNANPVVLDARGEASIFWAGAYKVVVTDSTGAAVWTQDNLSSTAGYSASFLPAAANAYDLGSVTYPWRNAYVGTSGFAVLNSYRLGYTLQTAAELAAGITPVNPGYDPGDARRYGFVMDSGTTDNTSALQNAVTACAGYCQVTIVNTGGYAKLTGPITVPAGSQIVGKDKPELRWTATTATGPTYSGAASKPGLNVTGNNVRIEGELTLTGPSGAGVYTSNEIGIICIGASAASPITGLFIGDQVEVKFWGSDGIAIQYVQDFTIRHCVIHDCGYAGIHHLTCTRGTIHDNEVYNITPGTAGNAYGISGTFTGTPTNSRSDANHFPIAVDVGFNFVHDIPLWIGIDFHGCFDCDIHDNRVYNCWTGIQVGTGNTYGGENPSIFNNTVNLAQYNGSATTVVATAPIGITVNGGGTGAGQYLLSPRVIGNTIIGYGNSANPPTAYSIQATWTDGAVIADNVFRNWQGYGIYSAASIGGKLSGNVFGALGSASYANAACIYLPSATTSWLVEGNIHRLSTGNAAGFGVVINTGGVAAMRMGNNDFASATVSQYGNSVGGALSTAYFVGQQDPLVVGASGSPISYKLKGTATFSAATTVTVTFGVTLPNTTYQVIPGGNAAGYVSVGSKTTTTFVLTCSASNSNTTDWVLEQ